MLDLPKSTHLFTRAAMTLALTFGSAVSVFADDIFLKDGRIIEGEILSPPDADTVNIRVTVGGLVAVQHFPKHQIRRIEYGVSARQEAMDALRQDYEKMLTQSETTATQWWELSQKLTARGGTAIAKDAAEQTISLDRHHEPARRLLGMVKYRGVWMRQNEIAAARGEVFFRGAWVSWDVQQQTLADETKRKEDYLAARKERAEQRRLNRIAATEAAAARAQLYPETYVSGFYRSPYYNPYGGGWRYPIYNPVCQPVVRPPICFPNSGIGWHVGASGGGNNHAWSFNWGGGSSHGSSFR